MTERHWIIQLTEPLPCGIRSGDVTCGQPAYAAQVWPDARLRGGELVLLPVCQECAQQLADVYLTEDNESGFA